MAKDLPYFKFFCSEWNDGDITLEDYKTQGLFINICSYYWSNECEITFTKLKKKFRGNEDLINELLKSGLIKECIDDYVSISFLDEQKDERNKTSKRNSESGKASAEKRRLAKLKEKSNNNSTSVEIPLNENPTNKRREEKIREEEIREDKSIKKEILNSNIWIEQIAMQKRENVKRIETLLNTFLNDLELQGEIDKGEKEIKKHFINWLNIELKKPKETKKDSFSFSKS